MIFRQAKLDGSEEKFRKDYVFISTIITSE